MSTTVAKRDAITTACTTISHDLAPKIRQAMEHPEQADRYIRVTLTAIQQNPALLEGKVHMGSLYNAVVQCAQVGLLPDGREAAFIRYYDKKTSSNKIRHQPMVLGFRKRAATHGFSLTAHVVYANDHFEHELGSNERIVHRPAQPGKPRGDMVAVYAIARHASFGEMNEVLYPEDIAKIKSVSKQQDGDLWTTWESEAWRKSAVRRLYKQLPFVSTDPRTAAMLTHDDAGYDMSPGPLADLPAIDPSEEYEPVEGEVVDDGLPEFGES